MARASWKALGLIVFFAAFNASCGGDEHPSLKLLDALPYPDAELRDGASGADARADAAVFTDASVLDAEPSTDAAVLDAGAADAGGPDAAGADAAAPDAAEADATGPDAAEADAAEADAAEADAGELDASQADAAALDATELDAAAPDAAPTDAAELDAAAPDADPPDATESDAAARDATAPDAAAPDSGPADAGIAVSVCPELYTMAPGEKLTFTPFVGGTSDQRVSWILSGSCPELGSLTANGEYTAPNACAAPIQVTVQSVVDPGATATATIRVVESTRAFAGTVTYGGTSPGRIHISLEGDGGAAATSLDAPGPFAIYGLQLTSGSLYRVRAWKDALGVGTYVAAADPAAEETFVFGGTGGPGDAGSGVDAGASDGGTTLPPWSGTLALRDPEIVEALTGPGLRAAYPFNTGAVVSVEPLATPPNSRREIATHYRIYTSTTGTPGPAENVLSRTIRAGTEAAILTPLVPSQSYWFSAAAIRDGVVGPVGPVLGPIVIEPPGGHAVSGVLELGKAPPAGATVLTFVAANDAVQGILLAGPVGASTPFVIDGVPDGSYRVGAVVDLEGDGELGPTDLATFRRAGSMPVVTVSGADAGGISVWLPSTVGFAAVSTRRIGFFPGGTDTVQLKPTALSSYELIVRARLVEAPAIAGQNLALPLDLGPANDRSWRLQAALGVDAAPPTGAVYVFALTTAAGVTCNIRAEVTGAFSSVPQPVSPVGTGSPTPLFSWQAPSGGSGAFLYDLSLWQSGGQRVEYSDLPASQLSFQHFSPVLTSGSYQWSITATDERSNEAVGIADFVVP